MAFTAKDVVTLREMTNAGMMDCKKALNETNGDMDAAVKWLREHGMAQSSKRAARVASQGMVASYIHMGGKIGVLVEVNCETDFAARSEPFQAFCKDICLQVCSASPRWVAREDVPAAEIAAEKEIYMIRARETGKPEKVLDKIADGMLNKWYKEVCLMEQPFVKNPDQTIEQLTKELSGRIGEKIDIRRFVRFQLGEGIEKKESNLADEVAQAIAEAKGN
ncbi:MAG TPA: translation elongation factor Ts [Candidatus Hydrogenedentes bacterium]|nr:translation elongation factor Ts [Candidatus Hydrogenedentota bacterium]HOT51874.1 translation elongation factor Ts [Candidatus Hydrogenedentota bacterium]HOV75213.1 translation elongation factor Ts [Candidatus Hydrogenedentota bacterium]HPC17581.1 translation elongation factor Ts [Candidatus Hydrogenedentota bacterium]HRT21466.1 translation elongation factor Ts [Candidatus Hydrogenedentota bacterium]